MCLSTVICVFMEMSPENIRSYIYSFSPPRPYTAPPCRRFPSILFLYMPSIPCPHALYAVCSSIYGRVLMLVYSGAYRALGRVIAIYAYYAIIPYILIYIMP